MGPSRPRNSTRARKAHPTKKPRRKPAPKPSADDRGRGAEAILKAARVAEPACKDGAPTMTLQLVQAGLETATALISVCAGALEAQAADSDTDVAIVLQRYALDTLARQQDRIELLLKNGAP